MTSQGTFPPTRTESGFLLMGSDSQPYSANCRMKSQYKFMEGMSVPGKGMKQGQVLDFLQIMRSLFCFQDFPHQKHTTAGSTKRWIIINQQHDSFCVLSRLSRLCNKNYNLIFPDNDDLFDKIAKSNLSQLCVSLIGKESRVEIEMQYRANRSDSLEHLMVEVTTRIPKHKSYSFQNTSDIVPTLPRLATNVCVSISREE